MEAIFTGFFLYTPFRAFSKAVPKDVEEEHGLVEVALAEFRQQGDDDEGL